MRSDARKRTAEEAPAYLPPVMCSCGHQIDRHNAFGCDAYVRPTIGGSGVCCVRSASDVARGLAAEAALAPIIALAESADRQFGSAQVITRDALWAAIAVARGEQS